jgi:predicted xylose isomerase-like sugar epimerase
MELHPDASQNLDAVTVFGAEGAVGEMQAEEMRSLLESAGIDAMVVGSSALPSLPFEVRVAAERADEARRIIEEAGATGAQALEQEFPPEA